MSSQLELLVWMDAVPFAFLLVGCVTVFDGLLQLNVPVFPCTWDTGAITLHELAFL
jgi:hypothetical protein